VFNLQGSELIIILLLALVVLGPEKLPDAMRKAGKMYADLKKMASGFQDEFRAAIDEPMREMRSTADMLRDSADFTKFAAGERDEKPVSATMADAGPLAAADPDAVPVDDLPFGPTSDEMIAGAEEFEALPTPDDTAAPDTDDTAGGT
jgi:sec-independent protein translocase protein TatB